VFASGKYPRPPEARNPDELHTNFRLSSGGEYLGLFNAESPPVAVSEFEPQFPEVEWTRGFGFAFSQWFGATFVNSYDERSFIAGFERYWGHLSGATNYFAADGTAQLTHKTGEVLWSCRFFRHNFEVPMKTGQLDHARAAHDIARFLVGSEPGKERFPDCPPLPRE